MFFLRLFVFLGLIFRVAKRAVYTNEIQVYSNSQCMVIYLIMIHIKKKYNKNVPRYCMFKSYGIVSLFLGDMTDILITLLQNVYVFFFFFFRGYNNTFFPSYLHYTFFRNILQLVRLYARTYAPLTHRRTIYLSSQVRDRYRRGGNWWLFTQVCVCVILDTIFFLHYI